MSSSHADTSSFVVRRGSTSSSVSSSSAGGLVASLAPLATAAVPMDDDVAPVAVNYSVQGVSGIAAAASRGGPVSPTSVASQFSNPSSTRRQKFGLAVESVGPKEPEEDNEEKQEQEEEEEEEAKDESAAAATPRASGRARSETQKHIRTHGMQWKCVRIRPFVPLISTLYVFLSQ